MPHGLRRDEAPTIRKPHAGTGHEIANRPVEAVEIQITHATEFAVRRRDRHPSQVTDTTYVVALLVDNAPILVDSEVSEGDAYDNYHPDDVEDAVHAPSPFSVL